MALAITTLARLPIPQGFLGVAQITASGTYPTGGDALDFAPSFGYIDPTKLAIPAIIVGFAGFIYQYVSATKKMLVFCNTAGGANAALGEHTNVAYVAGVTGDTIIAFYIFSGSLVPTLT